MLNGEGCRINRKRMQRLRRKMGIAALGPKPRTTKPAPRHKIFPYLLRHMMIDRPNQVWAADILCADRQGFLYLVAIIELGDPCGVGLAPVEHDGRIVLRVCDRRGLGALRPA